MDYSKMSDMELVFQYVLETCPYQKLTIAKHVKDDELRKKMTIRANIQRRAEDDNGRW